MSVFSYLQNELSGVGNSIANGVSNTYHAAVQNIGPYVSRVPQALSSAAHDTLNFGETIAAPAEGLINTVREIPALGYGALGAITPGHTFQGNVQQFNKVVPTASFAERGVQGLNQSGIGYAPVNNFAVKAGELAGSMVLPAPGIGKVAALERLASPALKLAGYTALRSAEGAAYGGANGLAQNGSLQDAKQGAEFGALTGGLGNLALSPKLSLAATRELSGSLDKAAGQVGASVRNLSQSSRLSQAANLFNKDATTAQLVRDANGKFITPQGIELPTRTITTTQFENLVRKGQLSEKNMVYEPFKNLQGQDKVTVHFDPYTGKPLAADGNPAFSSYLADAAKNHPLTRNGYEAYAKNLESRRASANPVLSTQELQRGLDNPATQFRSNPQGAALFANHPDVPLTKELPPNTGTGSGLKERSFVGTARESLKTDPEVKTLLSGDYQTQTHQATQTAAANLIASDPQAALEAASKGDSAVAIDTALQLSIKAQEQARALESSGDTAGAQAARQQAADLLNKTAENATNHGQAIEILKTYAKTPEGQALALATDINKYNADHPGKAIPKLGGEEAAAIIDKQRQIDALPETKPSEVIAKNLAQQKLWEQMADRVPRHGFLDKVLAVRRAGLLTGPKTVLKVGISHVIHPVSESISHAVGTALDTIIQPFSGFRGTVNTFGKGGVEGFKEGSQTAKAILTKGYDPEATYESIKARRINWGNSPVGKALQAYTEGVGRVHAALPEAGKQAAYQSSLYNLAATEAKNQGLHGDVAQSFITDFVKNPSKEAVSVAQEEAKHMVFQNRTQAGEALSKTQQGTGVGSKVSQFLAPMTQVPSAIGTEVANYSPAGAVKTIVEALSSSKKTGWTPQVQRNFVQGIGRSITGTALLYLGTKMAQAGIITTAYPSDQKTRDEWALEGKTANSILLGGKWRLLGSLGPAGSALILGAYWQKGMDGNKKTPGNLANAAIQTGVGGLASQADQPYVTGISSAANAIVDPERSALSFAKQAAGSFVPTLVSTTATATDPNAGRVQSGVLQAVQAKLPGLREQLPPTTTVFGTQPQRTGSPFVNAIDPFYSSNDTSSPLTNQLDVLAKSGNDATPTAIQKSITHLGYQLPLTPAVQTQLQQQSGQAIARVYQNYLSDPSFTSADPATQKAILDKAASTIRTQVEEQYLRSLGASGIAAAGGKATASTGVSAPKLSSSLKGNIAKKTTIATGGVKLSSKGRSVKGGKLTIGKVKAPKPIKPLTLKNVSGPSVKLGKPKSVVRPTRAKIGRSQPNRSLRRSRA